MADQPYVSRAGQKLAAALDHFSVDPAGLVCADLGSHVGGFVDCLLQRGAARVYSVDTAYGLLAWRLRKDPRVVVLERTNAMHVTLPEPVDLATIDVGWTRQAHILPATARLLKPSGRVVTLIKPHYEAQHLTDAALFPLTAGVLGEEHVEEVTQLVCKQIEQTGWKLEGTMRSPLRGHGGNAECLAVLRRWDVGQK
jgi:23S rRNA (cytidine1920-2'-O)/16S rRNA (cytidine1409-2'-O)-methyltransferase